MDHKVSKDMISSGMIPSGEKTQADLGRIQYGSAPSPSSLMNAYHSMYQDQKQENLDEKLDPQKIFNKSKRTLEQKQAARKNQQIRRSELPPGSKPGAENIEQVKQKQKQQDAVNKPDDVDDTSKPKKKDQSKGFGESNVDLLAAYYAVYEHHQKDENGNTIPHEGEELSEIISPAVQLGARKLASTAAKRGIGTAVKKAAGMAAKPLAGKTGLKAVGMAAKTLSKPGVRQGLKKAAGTAAKVGAIGATGYALGRAAQGKNDGGYSSYDINFGYTPEGDTLSEDLFDALKSALIEEGCDEKNAMKIMASVTPDYFNEIIEEENIDEVVVTGSVLAGLAAKKLLAGAIAKKVGAVALKKGIGAAAKTGARLGSKYIAQKGGKMAAMKAVGGEAGKGIMSAGKSGLKSAAKNPVNTALAGSMVMPQGGGGGAAAQPQAQRAVTSGKRTAGMQRMDLDLFDIVKGQLLDEGLTEEECNDVMTTLTIDEIREGLMPTTLKGALVRGVVGAAGGALAKKGLDKAKEKVDGALNKARDKGFGGNTRPGSDKIYFGK